MVFAIMKWILVLMLLATGTFFLLHGFGVDIPSIEYKGLKTHNLPAGFGILAAGIVLAVFWKIKIETTYEGRNEFGPFKFGKIITMFKGRD
jgi:hypothetical protein